MPITLAKCKILCKFITTMPDSDFSLNNPPLLCVMARVEFAKIPKIKDYAVDLHESLRMKNLWEFDERKSNGIHINPNAEAGPNITYGEEALWVITDRERKISLRVDSESITILFGNYNKFEQAEPLYVEVLQAIEQTIKGIVCKELQLRYINHIAQENGTGPDKWVKPAVLGMPNFEGLQRMASVSETSYRSTLGGRLVVRCSSMPNGLTLPPDLLPFEMESKLPLQSPTPFVLLENLHAKQAGQSAFSATACLEEFSEMRSDIHRAFQETATPQALEIWK